MSHDAFNPSNSDLSSDFDGAALDAEGVPGLTSELKARIVRAIALASDTAERHRENMADGLDCAALTIDEEPGAFPGGQNAADSVTDEMESTASYLRDQGLKQMEGGLAGICGKYPVPFLLSALAIGFLVGRTLRN